MAEFDGTINNQASPPADNSKGLSLGQLSVATGNNASGSDWTVTSNSASLDQCRLGGKDLMGLGQTNNSMSSYYAEISGNQLSASSTNNATRSFVAALGVTYPETFTFVFDKAGQRFYSHIARRWESFRHSNYPGGWVIREGNDLHFGGGGSPTNLEFGGEPKSGSSTDKPLRQDYHCVCTASYPTPNNQDAKLWAAFTDEFNYFESSNTGFALGVSQSADISIRRAPE